MQMWGFEFNQSTVEARYLRSRRKAGLNRSQLEKIKESPATNGPPGPSRDGGPAPEVETRVKLGGRRAHKTRGSPPRISHLNLSINNIQISWPQPNISPFAAKYNVNANSLFYVCANSLLAEYFRMWWIMSKFVFQRHVLYMYVFV